jgi:hypothetical protein
MTDCCPICGQTLPPERPLGLHLPPGYAVIFDRVQRAGRHGISARDLYDHVYGYTSSGGPECGLVVLRTRIHYLNKRHLRRHGMKIQAGAGRGSTGYVLSGVPA